MHKNMQLRFCQGRNSQSFIIPDPGSADSANSPGSTEPVGSSKPVVQVTFQIEISQDALTPGSEPRLSPQKMQKRIRSMYTVGQQKREYHKLVANHVTGDAATPPL